MQMRPTVRSTPLSGAAATPWWRTGAWCCAPQADGRWGRPFVHPAGSVISPSTPLAMGVKWQPAMFKRESTATSARAEMMRSLSAQKPHSWANCRPDRFLTGLSTKSARMPCKFCQSSVLSPISRSREREAGTYPDRHKRGFKLRAAAGRAAKLRPIVQPVGWGV